MISDLTAAKIDLLMLELRRRRIAGQIPLGQPITPDTMAAISREIQAPVSATTLRRIEQITLAKLRTAIRPSS